jgi:hypothetical protein
MSFENRGEQGEGIRGFTQQPGPGNGLTVQSKAREQLLLGEGAETGLYTGETKQGG